MEIEMGKDVGTNREKLSEEQAIFQLLRNNNGPFHYLHCLVGNTKSQRWYDYIDAHKHKCIPRVVILPDVVHISFDGQILYQNDKRIDNYKYEIQQAIKLIKDYQLKNERKKNRKQVWK